jgi:UDP-N-acetylmuramate--alanine ligase
MRPEAPPALFGRTVQALHCVGVGGMGLGPLAIYLAGRGFRVSGEDDALTPPMADALARSRVVVTGRGEVPADCQLVVYSSAIAPAHPAVTAARARQVPLVRRGEVLAEAVRDRRLVAICGSHGKTTTTAMLVTALRAAGFPTGYVLGGLFNEETIPPARAGSNDWVVAEIDESDGTIDRFSPEITVAVNLDWDHPDFYRTATDLEATFAALFARTNGAVLLSDTCAVSTRIGSASLRPASPHPLANTLGYLTFGRTGDFNGRLIAEANGRMTLALGGRFAVDTARVQAIGDFNATNAMAALAAAQVMGATLDPDVLANYPGVRRRQGVLHRDQALTALEDYAHHPAEIRALLSSLRRDAGANGRLLTVFQPHRFSRTRQFKSEFAAALAIADAVYLIDVYGAGEAPIAGGTTADLYADLSRQAPTLPVTYLPGDTAGLLDRLLYDVRPGDLVAFVGAGDVDQSARAWVQRYTARAAVARRWDELAAALKERLSRGSRVRREESLAPKTTMRIGGAARIYVEPDGVDDLQRTVRFAREQDVRLYVLGRGSNLLVPDAGVDGIVVSLRLPVWETFEPLPDGRVRVGAGLRLKNLCGLATRTGLGGFEFLEGIPGNVGGALRMNAGAMGGWMFDVVEDVDVLTRDGERRTFKRAEMHVDYRHCEELHDAIAISAVLRPAASVPSDDINRQIDTYRDKRQKTQPREPSAGCIFKNPSGDSAGRLIDACGLKGERVGGAEVSTVHGNFIVNRGDATSADVLALIRRVRARVEQQTGVRLQPEVLLYGARWEDVL